MSENSKLAASEISSSPTVPGYPQSSENFLPPKKKFPLLLTISLIVMAILAAMSVYLFIQARAMYTQLATSPTPSPSATAAASSEPLTSPLPSPNADPNIKTFTSQKLGITFQYQEKSKGSSETVATQEIGNKVYVYSSIMKPDQGQYVEIFDKSPSDTLEQAITKTILAGYSVSDCPLITDPKNPSKIMLGLPDAATQNGMENAQPYLDKCPKGYVSFGGLAYFLADSNHPTKFAFFSIGQYALNAGDNITWQDTFKFTN